jgi:hypothetical protein
MHVRNKLQNRKAGKQPSKHCNSNKLGKSSAFIPRQRSSYPPKPCNEFHG